LIYNTVNKHFEYYDLGSAVWRLMVQENDAPKLHSASHSKTGSDAITAQNLSSASAPAGKVLESDGAGGWALIDTPTPAGAGLAQKAAVIAGASFTGSPKKYTVSFATAFADANYVPIVQSGTDNRVYSVESITAAGFVINANSSAAISGNVYYLATKVGEA
jgi:hypothetical protein